ncbi:MAG: serine/threonine-protein kinase [Candidatus Latescibacterota bacterium]|jgi:tRNA A-37 threonylcarbamoyl transferase component Bud32
MFLHGLIESISTTRRSLTRRVHESSADFPHLRRKPRAMALWIFTAYRAHVSLLLLLLILQFGLPRLLNELLDRAIPERTSDKVIDLFGGESRSARYKRGAARSATVLAWIGGGSLVLLAFWIRVPAAVRLAAESAQRYELEADSLLDSRPSRSVVLYRSALALACDPDYEAELKDKISSIDQRLSRAETPGGGARQDGVASGAVAGRYEVVEELGHGANGVVYRANDAVLGREVALKELTGRLSDGDVIAPRFRQEARALARLNHPNIVQVYDFIEHDGRMWMAIELVEGGTLASLLERRTRLPAADAAALAERIADAVGFAHDRGVVHRDLKPLNVLLADEETPKVTDFGLAKLTEGEVHTLEGTVMGSPHYMSPEQANGGPVDHRSDIYSLGVILYQMMAGKVPFQGDIASVLAQHIRKPPPPLSKTAEGNPVPAGLNRLITAMLAKKPADRPGDMRDVAAGLGRFRRKPEKAGRQTS